jgi:protease-4
VVAGAGTLTGSIGVLAGKQVVRETLQRVGIRREQVSAGRYADMFSTDRPFDDDEWARVEGWLDRVYDDFTSKAATDRGMAVDQLRTVARGRVWTGADALEHRLVDEIGGLERAVELAAASAGVDRDGVEVRTFPRPTLVERFRPAENSESSAAAASLGLGGSLAQSLDGAPAGVGSFEGLLAAVGLAPYGVLSLPVTYRLQ